MALTVQTVANDAARETRKYFYDTATDAVLSTAESLFIGWVNEIHQDALHTSIWRTQLITSETFTSAPDGSPYILTANNIRHMLMVHDLKNRRTVIPYNDLDFPAATNLPPERTGPPRPKFDQTQQTSSPFPQYYIFESCILAADGSITQGLHLLPDPVDTAHSGTIRYWYSKMVDDVTAMGDTLLVPNDGRDILVAGVCMKISEYLKRATDFDHYRSIYEGMKKGF